MRLRTPSILLAVLSITLATIALSVTPALAALTHPYTGKSFATGGRNSTGPLGVPFTNPQGVAVEQATGTVYVYDAGAGSIYKFNSAGEKANFAALGSNVITGLGTPGTDEGEIAVDSSSGPAKGDIYVATGESGFHVLVYNSQGTKMGELKQTAGAPWGIEPCGVAVDSAGHVYVGLFEGETSHVNKYAPAANPVTNANYVSSLFGLTNTCNIAASSVGEIYADQFSEGPVKKYAASQFNTQERPAIGTEVDEHGSTLAIDPFGNHVYIDETSAIAEYDSSGAFLSKSGQSGPGALSESYGVAINHANGDLYADNGNAELGSGLVEIFGPAVVVPDVTTVSAANVTPSGARLQGSVNPDGVAVTSCDFEYGIETSYGSTIPCSKTVPFSGNAPVPVSAELTGLQKNTAYHYRLVARNANGASYGSDHTFTTPLPPPTVTISPVTEVGKNSATFNGTVNPNGSLARYHFEDSIDGLHWTPLAEGSAGEGTTEVPVSQPVTGLTGNTLYHVRLVATSGGESATSEETTFSTAATAPQAFGAIATQVTGTEATLSAVIYPENEPATYQFQYGTTTSYGSSAPAYPSEEVDGVRTVSQRLKGLQPTTVYHFRLIATNAAGPTTTADQTFRTGEAVPSGDCPNEALRAESSVDPQTGVPYSTQLSECRAYEQVTPPFKSVNDLYNGPPTSLSGAGIEALSSSGSPLLAQSLPLLGTGIIGADAEINATRYELARTSAGWTTTSLTPPAASFPVAEEEFASPSNVALGLWLAATPSQSTNAEDFYRREATGKFVDIGPIAPPSATTGPPHGAESVSGGPGSSATAHAIVGASTDLSHLAFQLDSPAPEAQSYLWPGDQTVTVDRPSLYEYFATGHTGKGTDVPALVGVDNHEAQISQCGTGLGGDTAKDPHAVRNGVSAGGSMIFFNAQAGGCEAGGRNGIIGAGPASNGLYARIGSPGASQATVNVAGASECASSTSCNVTSPVTFQGASSDGSKVFFTTEQALLSSDKDTTNDIYECELPGDGGATPAPSGIVNPCPGLRAISVTGTSSGANVQSVVAVSEGGSHVYFTATGVLTSTANGQGRSAEAGKDNLYVWEAPGAGDPSGRTSFIAVLTEPTLPGAQATPDGRYLVFTATADITTDDTSTAAQAFRYDAQTGELIRVSIGQDGFNSDGNTDSNPAVLASIKPHFGLPIVTEDLTVSTDGAYIVFQSDAALTPQVQGGKHNVYEWHDGNVSLISDGTDSQGKAGLIGMDASGQDVFFTTADKLVGQDTDEDVDVYDARIDGGFPAPQPAPSCTGEACQGPLMGSLTPPAIGSTALPAGGNLTPGSTAFPTPKVSKALTRAQKLAKALHACHKDRSKKKRLACEKTAHHKYGPPSHHKPKPRSKHK